MYNPFDKYYSEYDKWFDENIDIYKDELKFIGKEIEEGYKSLEVGAGTGRFGVPLGIRYGVEPSINMAKIARKNGMNIIVGTAENLPVKKNKIEMILLNTVICFMKDVQTAIQNFNRVLKREGIVIIFLIDRSSPIGNMYMKKQENSKFYKYAIFFSKDEIIKKFEVNGFTTVKVENYKYKDIDGLKLLIFRKL